MGRRFSRHNFDFLSLTNVGNSPAGPGNFRLTGNREPEEVLKMGVVAVEGVAIRRDASLALGVVNTVELEAAAPVPGVLVRPTVLGLRLFMTGVLNSTLEGVWPNRSGVLDRLLVVVACVGVPIEHEERVLGVDFVTVGVAITLLEILQAGLQVCGCLVDCVAMETAVLSSFPPSSDKNASKSKSVMSCDGMLMPAESDCLGLGGMLLGDEVPNSLVA